MNWIKKYRVGILFSLTMIMFLSGVFVVERLKKEQTSKPFGEEPVVKVNDHENEEPSNQDQQKEVIETMIRPYKEDTVTVARYFYDPMADESQRNQALVLFEGVYRPNQGVDYVNNNTPFDVYACLSGTVTKKSNDPVLGWLVTIESDQGVTMTYQSLSQSDVAIGAAVKQGDKIGQSGENIYEADLKNHLHLILEKEGTLLNPESYYDKKLNEIE